LSDKVFLWSARHSQN